MTAAEEVEEEVADEAFDDTFAPWDPCLLLCTEYCLQRGWVPLTAAAAPAAAGHAVAAAAAHVTASTSASHSWLARVAARRSFARLTGFQRQLVDDLLDRAFGGSVQKLVLQALSGRKPSREELTELRKLLNTLDTRRP
jgi:hypothetical protein